MKITISYRGQLGSEMGVPSEVLEIIEGVTLQSILESLAKRAGKNVADLIFDQNGNPRRTLLVAVDGDQVIDLETPINKGHSEIALQPPISGG